MSAFVATPAGAITVAYGPIILGGIGYMYRRMMTRLDRQDNNQITQDKGMAILVAQVAPMGDRLTIAESNINTLDKAQAVLAEQIRVHEEWIKQTQRRAI